jgi:hypothetical protein
MGPGLDVADGGGFETTLESVKNISYNASYLNW